MSLVTAQHPDRKPQRRRGGCPCISIDLPLAITKVMVLNFSRVRADARFEPRNAASCHSYVTDFAIVRIGRIGS